MPEFDRATAENSLPVLTRLRRPDCIKLMKAHGIEIPVFERNGRTIPPTKAQLMPILESHMGMETFSKKPKHPEFLLSPGERHQINPQYYVKNRGPNGGRWCIMEGKEPLVRDFTKEADAEKAMNDGIHLSTGSQ